MREPEMHRIADWMATILGAPADAEKIATIGGEVDVMSREFPLYPEVVRV